MDGGPGELDGLLALLELVEAQGVAFAVGRREYLFLGRDVGHEAPVVGPVGPGRGFGVDGGGGEFGGFGGGDAWVFLGFGFSFLARFLDLDAVGEVFRFLGLEDLLGAFGSCTAGWVGDVVAFDPGFGTNDATLTSAIESFDLLLFPGPCVDVA